LVSAGTPDKLLASLNAKKPSRLTRELLETARGMRDSGILDAAGYKKIVERLSGRKKSQDTAVPSRLKIKDLVSAGRR
jgi:hypothetical protein